MKGTLMNTKHVRQTDDDRGTGRIEAFSDGVIAVAITLLILDVQVPNVKAGLLLQALLDQWPSYLGYVTSFLVVGIFWANHHNMFRHIHQVDHALLVINSFFLMCIAFIPFATALLTKYITSPDQHTAALVYGATLLLNGILFNAVWWYAAWKHRLIRRDLDTQAVQRITRNYLLGLPFYALSTVLSLINVEMSLALYILVALIYGLPNNLLRFGKLEILSTGAQSAIEGHLPHTYTKNELPEVAREPE
jgi:uncharacterized membrane protein